MSGHKPWPPSAPRDQARIEELEAAAEGHHAIIERQGGRIEELEATVEELEEELDGRWGGRPGKMLAEERDRLKAEIARLRKALGDALFVCDQLAEEVRGLDGLMDLESGRTGVSVKYLNARAALEDR